MNSSQVCIIIPTTDSKRTLHKATRGDKKLISLQVNFLKKLGYKVEILSILDHPGVFPKIIKFLKSRKVYAERLKTKKHSTFIRNINWTSMALLRVFLYLVQMIDYKFINSMNKQVSELCRHSKKIVILNNGGELNPRVLSNKKHKKILIKYDIQYKLFSYLISGYLFKKLFLPIIQLYEKILIKGSDIIVTLNDSDKYFVEQFHEYGVVWVPILFKNLEEIEESKKEKKIVVGFLGSYWDLNIIGANKVLNIAYELKNFPDIEFWIIGSVGKALKKDNIPKNVKIMGWVDDLDKYLSKCDIFLNPKIGVTSGLEIKVLDYLQYNKPIITTTHGAAGLPLNYGNSIIEDDLSKWPNHILFLASNPEVTERLSERLNKDKKIFQDKMIEMTINIMEGR